MNKIEKVEDGYILTTEDGEVHTCTRWFEKKTGQWHVKLPKDNSSGRTYVRESHFDNKDIYEFETKTEFRTGLGNGGWRSKLTTQELMRVQELEKELEDIKDVASLRIIPKPEKNSPEWLELEIEKLKAQLAKTKKGE